MTLARFASLATALLGAAALAACHPHAEGQGGVPGDSQSSRPFSAIGPDETMHFTGTEPFWGGEARGEVLTYTTPSNPKGAKITVTRFAGRNGLGLSGMHEDKAFDMTVTPGSCGDGMSDRRYPFTVTLRLGEEVREGCGWSDAKPFSAPAAP